MPLSLSTKKALTQKILQMAIEGHSVTQITKDLNRSRTLVDRVVHSPSFQKELTRNLQKIQEEFLRDQTKISPVQKVEMELLDTAILCHRNLLTGALNEGIRKSALRLKSISEVYNFLKKSQGSSIQMNSAQIVVSEAILEKGLNVPDTSHI
jgi:hypothetical protein